MIVHLLDGTYELFRHFYGLRRFHAGADPPFGAVIGVLQTVLQTIEKGATHIGVATDHVIESFRNGLWPGYKTGDGVDPALLAQFQPLEDALAAMGVAVWPMVELEADDALASAARIAAEDKRVEKVCIWTPDKDLAQCVRGDRVVQVDRRSGRVINAGGVRVKFGVTPALIPDFLALVGDSADGYPGITGIGPATAAQLLNRYGGIEHIPISTLPEGQRSQALLFKTLATLRTDAGLFQDVDALQWRGPTDAFAAFAARLGDRRLLPRASNAAGCQSRSRRTARRSKNHRGPRRLDLLRRHGAVTEQLLGARRVRLRPAERGVGRLGFGLGGTAGRAAAARCLLVQDALHLLPGARDHFTDAPHLLGIHPMPWGTLAKGVPQVPELAVGGPPPIPPVTEPRSDLVHRLPAPREELLALRRDGVDLLSVLLDRRNIAHVFQHLQRRIDRAWAGGVEAAELFLQGPDDVVPMHWLGFQHVEDEILEVASGEEAAPAKRTWTSPRSTEHRMTLQSYRDISLCV